MRTRSLPLIIAGLLLTATVGHAQEGPADGDTVWSAEEILSTLSEAADEPGAVAPPRAVAQPDAARPEAEPAVPLMTARESYLAAREAATRAGQEADPEAWARAARQRVDTLLETLRSLAPQPRESGPEPESEREAYSRGFAVARSVRHEALARRQHRVHVFFDGRAVVLEGPVRRPADMPALLDFAKGFGYPVVNRLSVF